MNRKVRKCTLCAEEIPAESVICPFCSAEYEVTTKGYCEARHGITEADEEGCCRKCGGKLSGLFFESRLVEDPLLSAIEFPSPATPNVKANTRKCPDCAENIRAEARLCRYCGAEFDIVLRGYCAKCHTEVDLDENARCEKCDSVATDFHIESNLITEAAA